VAGVGAAAGGSAAQASSRHGAATAPIRLVYDWPGIDFEAVPIVVGEKMGFYKAAGVDVSIVIPPDNATTVKMIATGRGDIGFDTTTDVVFARNAGIPVVSIANYSTDNDWGLVAAPGKSINLKNLKGKSIGIFTDSWTTAMMPYVLRAAGLTANQVHEVIFTSDDIAPLLAGKIDLATNTLNYAIAEVEDGTGKKPTTLLATKFGAPNIPIWVFTAMSPWLASHGSEASAFLSATRKAFAWSIAHPAQAVADFVAQYPKNGSTPKYNVAGWEQTIPALGTPSTMMTQTSAEWSQVPKALEAVKLLKTAQSPSSYYTNQYLHG
jgi:NitT/TauT family transport system substrate-binding protein